MAPNMQVLHSFPGRVEYPGNTNYVFYWKWNTTLEQCSDA
jgi:hypothetical protein